MKFFVLVLILTGLTACNSQAQYRPGQCTKQAQGTLDWRVRNSEVVITGTITKIESESSHGEEQDEFDVGDINENRHPNHLGHQTVGLVKLWRVVKGSIEHVANYSYGTAGTIDGMKSTIIKLYGLWNNHVCGSFLNVGDTRIFFLRKLLDARPDIFDRSNETSLEVRASAYLGQLTSSIPTVDDVLLLAPPAEKHKKKRRRGKRGKKKGRRKSQNGERKKKSRKRRKKRARRKRKMTESMYQSLRKLRRPKRGVLTQFSLSQMQELPLASTRRDADEGGHVLVVVSSPARITLGNLNLIEGIVELE